MSRFMFFWPTDSQDEDDYDEHGNFIGGIPAPFSDRQLTLAKAIVWLGVALLMYLQFAPVILQLFQ